MRWISRREDEANLKVEQGLREVITQLRADLDAANLRAEQLTQTVCAMKVSGASSIRHNADTRKMQDSPDPVTLAIRQIAAGDQVHAQRLRAYARELLAEGKSPEDVAALVGVEESGVEMYQAVTPYADQA